MLGSIKVLSMLVLLMVGTQAMVIERQETQPDSGSPDAEWKTDGQPWKKDSLSGNMIEKSQDPDSSSTDGEWEYQPWKKQLSEEPVERSLNELKDKESIERERRDSEVEVLQARQDSSDPSQGDTQANWGPGGRGSSGRPWKKNSSKQERQDEGSTDGEWGKSSWGEAWKRDSSQQVEIEERMVKKVRKI